MFNPLSKLKKHLFYMKKYVYAIIALFDDVIDVHVQTRYGLV